MQSRISLAELIDSDTALRPDQAVAILREVCRQYAAGELRGIPNAAVIRLTPDGRVSVEGPINRDQDAVHAAASLLNDLLPGFDGPGGFKVPGGLRLVLARATRALDLPPFQNVEELCAALARFAAPDLAPTVSDLYGAYTASRHTRRLPLTPRETTISDIRRARRATGLSLEDVAQAAGVPAAKLRELEWGYMRNWPADDTSREDIRRYARVTGLDERLVLSTAWPLIEGAAEAEPSVESEPTVESEPPVQSEPAVAFEPRPDAAPGSGDGTLVLQAPRALVPLPWPRPAASRASGVWRSNRWTLALAAAVLLVIVSLAAWWPHPVPAAVLADEAAPQSPASMPQTVLDGPILDGPVPAPTASEEPAARPAAYVRPAAPRPAGLQGKRPQKRQPKRKAAPQRKSFLTRELFRIVIK